MIFAARLAMATLLVLVALMLMEDAHGQSAPLKCWQGAAAADGAPTTVEVPCSEVPFLVTEKSTWHTLPPRHRNWAARHPALLGLLIGGSAGTILGIHSMLHNECPTSYEGKPYAGFPCPGGKVPEPRRVK